MKFLDEDERLLEEALETEELHSVPNLAQEIAKYKSYAGHDLRQHKLVLMGTAHVNQLALAPHDLQWTTKILDILSQINLDYKNDRANLYSLNSLLMQVTVITVLLESILEVPICEIGQSEKSC